MTMGNKIAQYRKNLGITQEALAKQLGVTNQAVSKWESDQCCPDVTLLPKLADIFEVSLDELFGREFSPAQELEPERKKSHFQKIFGIALSELDRKARQQKQAVPPEEPVWPDDNVLRVAVYVGRKMVCGGVAAKGYEYRYHGDVDGVLSCISVSCGDVAGDVDSGRDVTCGNVDGDVDAGRSVNCGSVEGSVDAGTEINCGDVAGDVDAGRNVRCGNVGGDVDAGCSVECGQVDGYVTAGGTVTIRR